MSNRKETPDVLGQLLSREENLPDTAVTSPESTLPQRPVSANPEATPPPDPRPWRWEYLEVIFYDYRGGWRPRFLNREEMVDWKKQPLIHDYLNLLGAEGWEMVSMSDRYRNRAHAYFKRRK